MAFRIRKSNNVLRGDSLPKTDKLASQKRFAPNAKKVVARKASIPASLAKQPGAGPSGSSGQPSTPARPSQPSQPPSSLPEPSPTPELTQDDGLPPSIGSTWGGTPTIGSSQPVTQPDTQPPSSFKEPSLPPPSRKRAASPTPSNASKSSRTGGRPTMIHLAASSGPARRPTPSPSPAPPAATPVDTTRETPGSRSGPSPSPVPPSARPSPSPLEPSAPPPRVSPSPQQSAPKSALTAPRPNPPKAPAPSKKSIPAPAPTPTPPVQTSNLPPTISSTRAPSEPAGMPPMVGSSFIDPALLGETATSAPKQPVAGPSRPRTTEEFAQALVAEVAARPGPPARPPPRLTKQGLLRKKPGPPKGTKSANAGEPRAPRRKKTPEYDEDGNIIRVPRAPYGSKGKAGTDKDKRTRKNRSEKYLKGSKNGQGNVEGDEVIEFAEDEPIDPSHQKMGSFTKGFYDGDMTERAMKLKEAQREKREASKHERTEFERYKRIRTQPLRRRERAKRNEERAQRRLEWEAAGSHEGIDEVSDDEQDSTDEEYDFEPDRLTPPGTPEPENFDGDGGEEQEGVQGEQEIEEGLGDVAEYREDEDEDAEIDDQDWNAEDVNLADHGFNVQEDGEEGVEGMEGPPVGESGEPGEEDPEFSALFDNAPEGAGEIEYNSDGEPNFSFADYAANMENRRAQALATQNTRFVVTEDDDELRMINSTSWQKRIKTDKWTDDETDHFYSVSYLHLCSSLQGIRLR